MLNFEVTSVRDATPEEMKNAQEAATSMGNNENVQSNYTKTYNEIQERTPVDIMNEINALIKELSERNVVILDGMDNDFYLSHLGYDERSDKILFTVNSKG